MFIDRRPIVCVGQLMKASTEGSKRIKFPQKAFVFQSIILHILKYYFLQAICDVSIFQNDHQKKPVSNSEFLNHWNESSYNSKACMAIWVK